VQEYPQFPVARTYLELQDFLGRGGGFTP